MSQRAETSETDGIPPDVRARFDLVQQRVERTLSEAEADQIQKRIARSIALGVALREYPLTNADEPEIGFDPLAGGAK